MLVAILAIANIHGNFKTETHFGSSWFGPHDNAPLQYWVNGGFPPLHERLAFECIVILPVRFMQRANPQIALMNFMNTFSCSSCTSSWLARLVSCRPRHSI